LRVTSSENRYTLFRITRYPITIRVRGPSRRNNCSIADRVIETQPAVGPKFSRARCRNTALPRPAIRGLVL
jgi:hypothetical protein